MKILFTSFLFCLITYSLSSQSIVQATVSSGGSNVELGNLHIQSCLGQPFVNTYQVDGVHYQEGLLNGLFNVLTTNSKEIKQAIERIDVFPNPAENHCRLTLPQNEQGQIEIYDVDGRMVKKTNYSTDQVLSVQAFSPGLYFIKYQSKTLHAIARLIKV